MFPKSLFITTIYRPRCGGIEHCLENIIKRLPTQKAFILAQFNKGAIHFDPKQNYPIFRAHLDARYIKPRWIFSPLFAFKIARKLRPEMVHAAHGFASYLSAWALKKTLGLPYFVWAYGLDILSMRKSRLMRYLTQRIYQEAAGGVANSNFTKKEMARFGLPESKIMIVYPGVDPLQFQKKLDLTQVREKYHLPNQKNILLSVSRLVKRKGFDLVLRTLPTVLEKFPDTIYLIGGRGPDLSRLQSQVSKNQKLHQAVRFIDFVSDSDLPALYSLATVFLMPSRQISEDVEGFGMVFLEANACEIPVIGGNSGGIPEAILDGKTGFIVDPDDPQDLAAKIIQLIGDENLRKQMGEAGRNRAIKEFNWDKIVNKFQEDLAKISG